MPKPDTMTLAERRGRFYLSIEIDEQEFDTLSLCDTKRQRLLWTPWQATLLELLDNSPDDIKALDEKREARERRIRQAQKHLEEGFDLSEHQEVLIEAFEAAGETGLTMEEGIEACVEITRKRHPKQDESAVRTTWHNRYRAMIRDMRDANFIIETGEKRPTASSRNMAKVEGGEPKKTASAWRKRNLGADDNLA